MKWVPKELLLLFLVQCSCLRGVVQGLLLSFLVQSSCLRGGGGVRVPFLSFLIQSSCLRVGVRELLLSFLVQSSCLWGGYWGFSFRSWYSPAAFGGGGVRGLLLLLAEKSSCLWRGLVLLFAGQSNFLWGRVHRLLVASSVISRSGVDVWELWGLFLWCSPESSWLGAEAVRSTSDLTASSFAFLFSNSFPFKINKIVPLSRLWPLFTGFN